VKATPLQLKKRIEVIEREIGSRCPTLWGERELLIKRLEALEHGEQHIFAKMKKPHEAIMLCLDLRDHAMTVDEVFQMMQRGGFPMKPLSGRGTLNDLMRYHAGLKTQATSKPRLRRVGDVFGRAEWSANKFHD
jgi:hypothetical protein